MQSRMAKHPLFMSCHSILPKASTVTLFSCNSDFNALAQRQEGVVPFSELYPQSLLRVDGLAYTHAKKGPPPLPPRPPCGRSGDRRIGGFETDTCVLLGW